MAHILALLLGFPCVVFTVPLGVALLYWLTVVAGAAHVDLLGGAEGGGHDAGMDADGGDGGDAADGDAAHDGDDGDGDDGHEADGPGHGGGSTGGLSGLVAALKLRSAPATVVISLFLFFAWILSLLGMETANAMVPAALLGAVRAAVFFGSLVLALPLTSLAVRPIGKMFVTPEAAASVSLVGKICFIRTGTVTAKFGEATLADGGAGLVLRVRIDDDDRTTKLKRGEQVVITAYDPERQEFTVAPMKMSELLAERDDAQNATADAENVGDDRSRKA